MSFLRAIWRGNSKHKKLCEEWALASSRELGAECEPPPDGVSFVVKYLGSTLVETPSNETATAEAIKTVITMAKASGRKLQRVALTVSLRGIKMVDLASDEVHLDVSIYRISYCSADATYDHVFAFIATNSNETMECHAFLCPKRKMAQAVTLTVAQSFNTAYELWRMSEGSSQVHGPSLSLSSDAESMPGFHSHADDTDSNSLLIDLSEPHNGNSWVCFDDDRTDNLNSNFSRLATGPMPKHSHMVSSSSRSGGGSNNSWGDTHSINLLCS